MKKTIRRILLAVLIIVLFLTGFFFVGSPEPAEEIVWGVNFSQKHAELLGLDWETAYLALLDELGVGNLKLITHWDLIEPEEGEYDFRDLDWQVGAAEERGASLVLVVGMKTGRWPECHVPEWASDLDQGELGNEILELVEEIVLRYRDSASVAFWQVENEPFFSFGECPETDEDLLDREIALVRSLDGQGREIIVSDSGELSLWFAAAGAGDLVGTTLHRKVWFEEFDFYVSYPFRPVYYWRKAQLIEKLFGKEVICGELQAEPWCPVLLYDCSLEEQEKTMDLERFRENIEYARKTGLDTFYFWGAEWWYWMKTEKGDSSFWDEAQKIF